MIPKKLTIEGLYSYKSAQTIDFDDLTAAGLFGIFGKVGSGKSSILEAITVALYGSNDRLGNKVASSYDLMNLKSSRLYISLEFLNYENRLFRIDRRAHRNRNDFHDVIKDPGGLYAWDGTDWKPVVDRKVEDIVGMNFENFRRTIIIPQGKFKEFMELGNTERTKMLREIFSLHRYDLSNQVKLLSEASARVISGLEGELSTLQTDTPETLTEEQERLKAHQTRQAELSKALETLTQEKTRLEKLRNDTQLLQQRAQTFNELKAKEAEINALHRETETFARTQLLFGQPLAQYKKITADRKTQQEKLNTTKASLEETQKALKSRDEEYKKLQPHLEKIDELTHKAADYDLLAEAAGSAAKMAKLESRIKNGDKFINEQEAALAQQKADKKQTEEKRKILKTQALPAGVLAGVQNWFDRERLLKETLQETTEEVAKVEATIQENREKISKLAGQPENIDAYFQQEKKNLADQLTDAEERRNTLEVQEKLAHYAENLHDGEPCPLCGSAVHPYPLSAAPLSAELAAAREAVINLKQQQDKLTSTENKVQQLLTINKTLAESATALQEKLSKTTTEHEKHREAFEWTAFSAEDEKSFNIAKQKQDNLQQQLEQAEQQLEALDIKIQKEEENLKKYRDQLDKIRREYEGHERDQTNAHGKLTILTPEEGNGKEAPTLKDLGDALRKEIAQYQQREKNLLDLQNTLNKTQAAQEAAQKLLQQEVERHTAEEKNAREALDTLLAQEQTDQPTVEQWLQKNLPTEANRKSVTDFRQRLETARQQHAESLQAVGDKTFQPEALDKVLKELNEQNEKHREVLGQLGAAQQRIQTLEKNLKRKAELDKEMAEQQLRAENLKTMKSLFDRQGFVDFISSEYLRQLVAAANERFHRMTHHQLNFDVNERNGFDVVDYLNEGRRRSVKTLSGGQSFQASLSLALALAESVQTQAQATQNFFFIDEGFGTQDPESVNIVFDTLQDLQKGNRIVGIISHLDELKERIPVSLEVRNDPERGSEVRKVES